MPFPPSPREAELQFHFLIAAPAISGPEDFQHYVTSTEFTEEAILMKVQVSRPWTGQTLWGCPLVCGRMGTEENEVGLLWIGGRGEGGGEGASEGSGGQ